jgi:hypothetical protein
MIFVTSFLVSCKKINSNESVGKAITQICPSVGENAGPDKLICTTVSSFTQLGGLPSNFGFSYHWTPITGLSNPNISNPIASPTTSMTYTLYTSSFNYVNNGDFELGNTGFTSDYIFNNYITPQFFGTFQYRISQNPYESNSVWCRSDDHTIYGNKMMLVDGNCLANGPLSRLLWSQDVINIQPNTSYYFSLFIKCLSEFDAIDPFFPFEDKRPNIEVKINGIVMSNTFHTFRDCNNWEEISFPYNPGALNHAIIEIKDLNLAYHGNDFVLDDIYLGLCDHNLINSDDVNVSVSTCTNTSAMITNASYFKYGACSPASLNLPNEPIIPSLYNSFCTFGDCGGYIHLFSNFPDNNQWYFDDVLIPNFGGNELITNDGNHEHAGLNKYQVKNTTYSTNQLSPPTFVSRWNQVAPILQTIGYYKTNYIHNYYIPIYQNTGNPNTSYSWAVPGCTVTNLSSNGDYVQITFPSNTPTTGIIGTLTVSNSSCLNGAVPIRFEYNPNSP